MFKFYDFGKKCRKACLLINKKRSVFAILTLLAIFPTLAQTEWVSGTVTDKSGEPLIGVTVKIEGTTTGTATDIDGKYRLDGALGKNLLFSYIGYLPQTLKATSNILDVVLQDDNVLLDEVVVVGYGTMQRKDLTGSITTVNSKDLNVGAYTDPGQLLQGKVPGLVVVQNSDPNAGVNSITLRGASTLNGSTEPLYVVDGIPGVQLNLVPPNEIESIDVLRDASATAIYGSKAANGVIIITTKRGADGPARVSYQGYVSWEKIANDHKMMTGDQLRKYGQDNPNLEIPNDLGYDTNWQKEVQRTGFATNHNLAISGGGKSTTYTASVNYLKRDGIIKGVGNNLFTARGYVETKTLKDHLTLGVGINGNVRNEWGIIRDAQGASVYEAMYYYSPLEPVRSDDGNWYHNPNVSQYYNPLALINEDTSKARLKRLQVTGKASIKIIEGLLLNGNFAYETQNYHFWSYNTTKSQTNKRHGEASQSVTDDFSKLIEIYANYDKTFKEIHKLSLMAGYSWEDHKNGMGFSARGYNFYDDTLGWNNIGMANDWDTDPVSANLESHTRMISFYGRANYSLDSRYIFQVAVRRDGASTFGNNNKWATFPSASVAWRFSQEKWLQPLGKVGDFKIRVGWGQSGNASGFDIYTAKFYYTPDTRFDYTDPVTGEVHSYKSLRAARNVNDDLRWETTTMLNVGLDYSFLGGRINGTIEYYNKDTKDMIWGYPVSTAVYPVDILWANVGKMRNRGVEFSINAVPIQGPFIWSTSFNLSHNQNKVVSISNSKFNAGVLNQYDPNLPGLSQGCSTQRIVEGEAIGTFYMWEWAGYNKDGVSTFYERDLETGDYIYDDVDGVKVKRTTLSPGEKDRIKMGTAQPKLTIGWNNNLTWKNWDMNIFFTGVFGQKIFNEPHAYFSYIGAVSQGKNVLASVLEDQLPTDGLAHYPSDRYLEDGSYFKLSTLTLGYTFRNCFNGWLNDIRLYVSGNNIFTITKYKGRDPEINLGGLQPGHDSRRDHYPRARQIIVGVNVNF